ncbi:MAG: MFS transporter [Myxococcota bacterium]
MSALAAWQSPAFRRYQGARLCGILGMQALHVATGWQIYELTRRPLDLGIAGGVQFLPLLFLFPITGSLVDRFDPRRIVALAYAWQAVLAAALAAMTWAGLDEVWPIWLVLLGMGVGRSLAAPASSALLPQTVPIERFANAASWTSTVWSTGVIVGPALGGAMVAWAGGAAGAYVFTAALLVVGLAQLARLEARPATRAREPVSVDVMLAGLRYLWSRPILLGAVTLDLFAVLLGGAVALLPVFAKDLLAVGPEGLGLLRGAPAAGALVTAAWLSFHPVRRHAGLVLYGTVAIFGLATVAFGLSESFWLSLAALVVVGASDEVSVFIRRNVVLLATPEELRGRVSAAEFVFISASNELGELESGLAAAWLGPKRAVVWGGLGTLAVVAIAAWRTKELRTLDRMEELKPG